VSGRLGSAAHRQRGRIEKVGKWYQPEKKQANQLMAVLGNVVIGGKKENGATIVARESVTSISPGGILTKQF